MGRVTFQEEGHIYYNTDLEQYTSVTTWIGQYKNKFDSDYWSLYKAYERLYIEKYGKDSWTAFKRSIGGYKQVVPILTKEAEEKGAMDIVRNVQNIILTEWNVIKDDACAKGTAVHLERERQTLQKLLHEVKAPDGSIVYVPIGKTTDELDKIQLINLAKLPDGVYPELLIWNHELKLAGQADKVTITTLGSDRFVDILDYKTNKKLDKEGFDKQTMLPPLQHIQDCNFGHYELQISIYQWMLECYGFTPRGCTIEHTTENKFHNTRYLKEEVLILADERRKRLIN